MHSGSEGGMWSSQVKSIQGEIVLLLHKSIKLSMSVSFWYVNTYFEISSFFSHSFVFVKLYCINSRLVYKQSNDNSNNENSFKYKSDTTIKSLKS